MFPSVSQPKQQSPVIKQKIRQKNWDDRFIVQHGIPQYSPLKDIHTKSYQKLLINSSNKKDDHGGNRKANYKVTFFEKRVQIISKLKEVHPNYVKNIKQYEDVMSTAKIPNFYIFYAMLFLLNHDDIPGYTFVETKNMKQQTSPFHRISTSVRARQQCLERLRKTLMRAKQSEILSKKDELHQQFTHLRLLTANAIDEIKRWRDKLTDSAMINPVSQLEERPTYYTHSNENYLLKLLNDNHFVFSSELSEGLNFGERNDPFIIVPLKRAQGKQSSAYVEIIQVDRDLSYYQKYMEYLASEKAYELKNAYEETPKKQVKSTVQKVYSSTKQLLKSGNSIAEQRDQAQDGQFYHNMEKNRLRQERLKKNSQRISSIKSIYETYSKKKDLAANRHKINSEKKVPETDGQQKRQKRNNNQKAIKVANQQRQYRDRFQSGVSDNQFDSLVKAKVDYQRKANKVNARKKEKQSNQKQVTPFSTNKIMTKTMSKSLNNKKNNQPEKSQDQMIQSLRDIQTSLKSKLQVIKNDKQPINLTIGDINVRSGKKNNQQIIRELKQQIMSKIEKQANQKQRMRKKKRQDQQVALQEIKSKLKRQMQQKLEQKKKEKMIEREQLQRKLKQQEDRLNNQRNLELQLQLKLAKERQLRELEKIRRQALEKQKKFREELQKQQRARREQEQTIEKERKQKEKLLEQLRKKQLKQQIQQQLKKQLKERQRQEAFSGRNSGIEALSLESLKKQKEAELSKQIEYLKQKETTELQQMQRENHLRERMLRLKQQEEQLKRKQIEMTMKRVIQQDKQLLERQSSQKRIQLQESMRSNVKQKLLQEYRNQKLAQLENLKHTRQGELQQQVYRQKIRQKLEKEMRMQAIERTRKQMDERQSRKMEVRQKLDKVRDQYENTLTIDRDKIEEEVKKDMIEKVIFQKQADRQNAKIALRAQFQRELLASSVPQIYQNKQSHALKNTSHYQGDPYLYSKMGITDSKQKPTNDRSKIEKMYQKQETPVKQVKQQLTNEQLQIYSKQKSKIFNMREQPLNKAPTRLPEEEQGFELMRVQKDRNEQQGYDVKIVRKSKQEQRDPEDYPKKKKAKKVQESQDSEDIEKQKKRKENQKRKKKFTAKKKVESSQENPDSQDQKKKKRKKKHHYKQSESAGDSEEVVSPAKKKIDFRTSEDETKKKSKKKIEEIEKTKEKKAKESVIHFDVQSPSKVHQVSKVQPVTIKPVKQTNDSKFKISVDAIPEEQLDEYLENHFSKLPQQQLDILLHDRQVLYRKLIGELTFCLLLAEYENKVIGMAFACHDRSRSDCRKFVIVHSGTYKTEHLKDFILSITNYIFRKDPTDQIEFHFVFDQAVEQQLQFSTDFNKWFDKYGSVYQKKAENQAKFERKYVLKRQFNQKCEVVLGGINKNTFRNIFSVYSGVVMSNTDLLSSKQDLNNSVYPENEVSYAIMIAQLFRNYLTPDQAEALKNNVKQFAKLKELLVLVVMLQKKKVKMDELKLWQQKNLIELNMKLMSQGKDVIKYAKDSGMELNRVFYCELNHGFNLPFHFQTTSLPVQAKQTQIRQISYFRLSPLPPFKLHIIKSSLYNAQLNILPTENSKYKLFVMSASEYDEIKQQSHLDLFMYIRLFLKNVKSHNVAAWKYVWLPEMTDKGQWSVRQFRTFLDKDIYCHDSVNISYRQFLPGALIIQPEHRDLVITPPFIVGVMSMTLEQVTEGSPLYARYIDIDALKTLEIE